MDTLCWHSSVSEANLLFQTLLVCQDCLVENAVNTNPIHYLFLRQDDPICRPHLRFRHNYPETAQ